MTTTTSSGSSTLTATLSSSPTCCISITPASFTSWLSCAYSPSARRSSTGASTSSSLTPAAATATMVAKWSPSRRSGTSRVTRRAPRLPSMRSLPSTTTPPSSMGSPLATSAGSCGWPWTTLATQC
uniref:Macaca fascicularis brain cDNA clone: QtrA-17204, similar to human potassium voltage-gated channel, delayed-rectifier,subfamily S, member 2 (KCNS2), mRNA, RefSeq: NM_020697.2 n=1 Tax=Macaca fascicularis TaxID=9541 RepID=G7PCA8_MACFA|nr:unnamed protein product [Macaca fascicularis]